MVRPYHPYHHRFTQRLKLWLVCLGLMDPPELHGACDRLLCGGGRLAPTSCFVLVVAALATPENGNPLKGPFSLGGIDNGLQGATGGKPPETGFVCLRRQAQTDELSHTCLSPVHTSGS